MPVQSIKPVRRIFGARAKYQDYRDDLRDDFNGACGYCDDSDRYLDRICFHVDHFAPKDQFPAMEIVYANLVYSCRYCNIRKSNIWISDDPDVSFVGDEGFIDPCSVDYDHHLERHSDGRITAQTTLGQYMVDHLNLHLLRHQLLWNSRKARLLRNRISELRRLFGPEIFQRDPVGLVLLNRFVELSEQIDEYEALAANE